MNNQWPTIPNQISEFEIYVGGSRIFPGKTACKHGFSECERCGTTNRRDVRHSTVNGTGEVGKLFGCKN